MKSFTDLDVWKFGLKLVSDIYQCTKSFPSDERFALTSQMRRASTSILANIAEGFGRFTFADKAGKYVIARGECTELEAEIIIAATLTYLDQSKADDLVQRTQRVGRMLSGLIESCRNAR